MAASDFSERQVNEFESWRRFVFYSFAALHAISFQPRIVGE
jgi:hypothetical protein